VKDGRIVEVGGTDEILWLREDEYEVIDLDGRTVIPGFVDPHNHFSIGALEVFWPDCRTADSRPGRGAGVRPRRPRLR
jgi:predicted amidohydrolase YtcJ